MAPGYELGSDIDDCTARCARLPWCVGVSFDPARSRCYHATATTPSRSAPHSSSLSMLCPLAPSGEELPPENETWSYTAGQGSNGVDAAARAAAAAEVTVLSVATQSAEGNDRASLSLGRRQETLIHAVLAAAPGRVVVVVRAPGAVSMPWAANITAARAIILQLMPGQAAGTALAAILFGDIEPTGRLPITFPYTMAQSWLENSTSRFPGVNDSVIWAGDPDARAHPSQDVQATYSEGLYMGYRYYGIALSADRNEDGDDAYRGKLKAPLWPFGHGLGFNEWTWNDLRVVGVVSELSNATVYVTLSNYYGMTASSTVVQLYVAFPEHADEPPELLRGFTKVTAPAGGQAVASFSLDARALSVWNATPGVNQWCLVEGEFGVRVGSSSRDELGQSSLRGSVQSKRVLPNDR